MTWKKWVVIGSGVVVLGVGLNMAFASKGKVEGPQYRMARVERGDVVMSVSATGTLNAIQTVEVGSQVSGIISELHVDFNSVVRQGEVIAQIDPTFLQAQVIEAEANLERSQASVNEAKNNLDRSNALVEQQFLSKADLDQRKAAHETAVAGRKQADAALQRSKVNLKYATIRAPISGVVISREVEMGQTVAASLQAPKIFTIANDLTKMKLETNIDEADIGKIQEGQKVNFTVDAYPETPFEGKVAQIRLAPITSQNVVTYTVIVEVPNPDQKLRPGMTANVTIVVDQRFDVLRISALALRFRPPMGPGMGGMMGGAAAPPEEKGIWGRITGWFKSDKADSAATGTAGVAMGGPGMRTPGAAGTSAGGEAAAPATAAPTTDAASPGMRGGPGMRVAAPAPGMRAGVSAESGMRAGVSAESGMRAGAAGMASGSAGQGMGNQGGGGMMGGGGGGMMGGGGGGMMGGGGGGMMGGGMGRGPRGPMLWTKDATGQLKPVRIRTGISDGTYTEVLGDAVTEGMEVILSATGGQNPAAGGPGGGMMMFGGGMGGGRR